MATGNDEMMHQQICLKRSETKLVAKQAMYMGSTFSSRLERISDEAWTKEDADFDEYISQQHPAMNPDPRYKNKRSYEVESVPNR